MKKSFWILLFAISLPLLLLMSCEKTCTCKTYKDGVLTGEAVERMTDEYRTCSDMNIILETENGVTREVICN
jgi:hypothetical protein